MKCIIRVLGVEGDARYIVPRALRAYADAIERGDADPNAAYQATLEEPKREPLTARQQRVYDAITKLHRDKGIMPSSRELMKELDIKSTNGVREHLLALARKGYIVYMPGLSRGVKII